MLISIVSPEFAPEFAPGIFCGGAMARVVDLGVVARVTITRPFLSNQSN